MLSECNPRESFESRVDLKTGDKVELRPINWLWPNWLASGKVHILGGTPGTGKTSIAMAFAATISGGGQWPDGSLARSGNVAIWSGEDDPGDTLVPRLLLSGANLSKVYFVSGTWQGVDYRSFDPAHDIELLRHGLSKIGNVDLLIIDPIVSAVGGDSHKNAEVRRGLQPLADLSMKLGCATIGITHFTKNSSGREPIDRITGSLAFGALARVVLVATKCREGAGAGIAPRMLLRAKSNIGPDDGGFRYDLRQDELSGFPGVFSNAVQWGDPIQGSARDLLADAEESSEVDDGRGAMDEAVDWLRDTLENKDLDGKRLKDMAGKSGISERTLYRAAKKLGVLTKSGGFGAARIWHLCPPAPHVCHVCQSPYTAHKGTHGKVGTHGSDQLPPRTAEKF